MPKHKKPNDFIRVPQYLGGNSALKKFLDENLIYPEEAIESKVEGDVEAEYHVDGLGKIKNVKILKKLGSGCDDEVIRLIKLLVYEKAINRGLKTLTRKTLKIAFKLPKQKDPQINYSIIKEPKSSKPVPKKSMGYTITFN